MVSIFTIQASEQQKIEKKNKLLLKININGQDVHYKAKGKEYENKHKGQDWGERDGKQTYMASRFLYFTIKWDKINSIKVLKVIIPE